MEEPPTMTVADWLDDLSVRFIINLPEEDLTSVARICFQIEEAQWFYEDFIRPLDPRLPSMPLRVFCLKMFQHCPLLASFSEENHMRAFEQFLDYKTRIPVRGAIMLNQEMDSAVLVKGWKKGSGWSFPRGKINKDEDDLECAIREVDEETGFDIRAAGLVPTDPAEVKYIEKPIREQNIRLYVFRGVPMDTQFFPRTRKEISKIEWWKLSDLPTFKKKTSQEEEPGEKASRFYMVAPFLGPVRQWVGQQQRRDAARAAAMAANTSSISATTAAAPSLTAMVSNLALRDQFVASSLPAAVLEEPSQQSLGSSPGWLHQQHQQHPQHPQQHPHQPAPQQPPITGSDVKASLDDTTRELQRKWNAQSHVSAVPTVAPTPVSTDRQDKGASLLALLQKGPAASPALQPGAAAAAALSEHEFAQATAAAAAAHFSTSADHRALHQPALAHPQPLPPQARSLLVGATATAAQPARRRVSGSDHVQASDRNRVHLVPHAGHSGDAAVIPEPKYTNPRQHPQFLQATAMPSPPQALSHLYRDQNNGRQSVYGEKHRSALLDMFTKKSDGASPAQPSPRIGTVTAAAASPRVGAAAITSGEDIHRGLLSLLPRFNASPASRPQTMPPGAQPAHNNPLLALFAHQQQNQQQQQHPHPQPLLQPHLQQQIHQQPIHQHGYQQPAAHPQAPLATDPRLASVLAGGRPMASPMFSSIYGPNPTGSSLAAPPDASSFPAPGAAGAYTHANGNGIKPAPGPPQHTHAHKQHLLSLFGSSPGGSGGGLAAGAVPAAQAQNGEEPTSSAADRSFLLGYLESATKRV